MKVYSNKPVRANSRSREGLFKKRRSLNRKFRSVADMSKNRFKVDRSAFSIVSFNEQDEDEKRFWRSKTPHERLEAVETIRQVIYGYDPASSRLLRVLEIAERA